MAAKDLTQYVQRAQIKVPKTASSTSDNARVFRYGSGYICGICHGFYGVFNLANQCIQRCTLKQRLSSGVLHKTSHKGDVFVCSLCAKSSVYLQDAQRCFESCKSVTKTKAGLPLELLSVLEELQMTNDRNLPNRIRGPLFKVSKNLDSDLPKLSTLAAPTFEPNALILKPAALLQEQSLLSEISDDVVLKNADDISIDSMDFDSGALQVDESAFSEMDVPNESRTSRAPAVGQSLELRAPAEEMTVGYEDSVVEEASGGSSHEVSNAPAKRDKDGNVMQRKPGMKPFKRADAKYVCTVCSEKFFTKSDVEACFFAHPLDEMV